MIRPILAKDLRESALPFSLLLLIVVASALALTFDYGARADESSLMEPARTVVILGAVIAAAYVMERLIAREYVFGTQLFLEALPISRLEVVTAKLILGTVATLTVVAAGFLSVYLVARSAGGPPEGTVPVMIARGLGFAGFACAFFFATAFLGRYRIVLIVQAALTAVALQAVTTLEVARFGPFRLVDRTYAYERGFGDPGPYLVVLAGSAVLVGVGYGLALVREGSVANLVAARMSTREKVFFAFLAAGTLFAFGVIGTRQKERPLDLVDAAVASGGGVEVKVSRAEDPLLAEETAAWLHRELSGIETRLWIPELPIVLVVARSDVDRTRFEHAAPRLRDRVLVRARLSRDPSWRASFFAWLLREVLIVRTRGRAEIEMNRWVLDGVGLQEARSSRGRAIEDHEELLLRALYAAPDGVSRSMLERWLTVRERVGDEIAQGLAWSGLLVLEEGLGASAYRSFLAAVLAQAPGEDARALYSTVSVEQALASLGVRYEDFIERWTLRLEDARAGRERVLARLPRLSGACERGEASLVCRLRSEPALEEDLRVALRYAEAGSFYQPLERAQIRAEDHAVRSAHAGVVLPPIKAPEGRVAWTFAFTHPALGCELISGWKRENLP